MLAAIRRAAQRPLALRASTSAPSRAFSSRNEPAKLQSLSEDTEKLHSMLNDVSGRPQTPNKKPGYRGFMQNQFIAPHRLEYDSVVSGRPFLPRRRPQVGPSKKEAQKTDPFYQLNIDPLSYSLNPWVLSNYVSEMGKVHGRTITKLTMKNQRRLGKAIRRAKMMGVIPVLSRRNILSDSTLH